MDLFEAIAHRHSYRGQFQPEAVPEIDLKKIVQAGIQAPSGCNAQTTEFIIVNNQPLLKDLATIIGYPFMQTAPAVIVCVTQTESVYHGLSFAVEDCSAAVENMLLAITALGYASVWIDGVLRTEDRAGRIGRLLGVPGSKQVQVVLPVGIPTAKHRQKLKKPFFERAWFNRYQGS